MPTCDAMIELLEAHELSALDPEDARALERHAAGCPECAQRLAQEAHLAGMLALAAPRHDPPLSLKRNMMAAVRSEPVEEPHRSWMRSLFPAPVAAGAAALAACAAAISVGWALSLEGELNAVAAATPVVAAASSGPSEYALPIARADMRRLIGSDNAPDARGWMYIDPAQGDALLVAYKLPQLAPDKAYQLWLVADGQRVSGGTFEVDQEGYGWLKVKSPKPLGTFQRVGITAEPKQGSLGPTGPRVLGGDL